MIDFLRRLLNRALESRPVASHLPSTRTLASPVEPVTPRVLMIVHNPPVLSEGGRRLTEIFGWNDPERLARQYIADLEQASGGYVRYRIVERIDADWFPPKIDGFRYTGESYVAAWRSRQMHEPDRIDYVAQVKAFNLIERYERGEFDEVWFFSFPYAGDYESTMVGRNAFWCNSPPVPETGHCSGRFVIMAFNYERDVDCMLENFGHRVESIMSRVFASHPPEQNLWALFTRYDKTHPGQAHCGNVHFAPNSEHDYDWGNPRPVISYCDDWLTFPELPGRARWVDCREWGGGDMRLHHLWWLSHLPRVGGETFGVSNNWWSYVIDPNLVS
ncbi:MAG: hypothetical protein J7463_04740 [Roseiflexus sp.]|jgi:hypothetical protein|nr:hypothetical protein [Roseiflexus sp.]MBO9336663.1 hypothetical protein [Roseiflexus sp.]MBO9365873.1 hypothetical protein [Roseiflexus sp.]MBO9382457.1 hypothetical protein [Roseiflexus sp.]MBO9390418.1 hypothetical protein [Roseiflexus sp.]